MASKRRIRRRQCEGKVRHETLPDALRHSRSLSAHEGGSRIAAYRCQFCGGFHVGHSSMRAA
jgi:hypothetical protein